MDTMGGVKTAFLPPPYPSLRDFDAMMVDSSSVQDRVATYHSFVPKTPTRKSSRAPTSSVSSQAAARGKKWRSHPKVVERCILLPASPPLSPVSSSSSTLTSMSSSSTSSSPLPYHAMGDDGTGDREGASKLVSVGKAVRFDETAKVLWIEGSDGRTAAEWDACRFTHEDYFHFRDREKAFIRQLSDHGTIFSRNNEDDVMGVETRQQRSERRRRCKEAVWAVKFETLFQTDYNPIRVAEIYRGYTEESRRSARKRAIWNAVQVGQNPKAASTDFRTTKAGRVGNDDVKMTLASSAAESSTTVPKPRRVDHLSAISLQDLISCTNLFLPPNLASLSQTDVHTEIRWHARKVGSSETLRLHHDHHISQDPADSQVQRAGPRPMTPPQPQIIVRQGAPPPPRHAASHQHQRPGQRRTQPPKKVWVPQQQQQQQHQQLQHFRNQDVQFYHSTPERHRHRQQHLQHQDDHPYDHHGADWRGRDEAYGRNDQALANAGIVPPSQRWTWNPILCDFVPTPRLLAWSLY